MERLEQAGRTGSLVPRSFLLWNKRYDTGSQWGIDGGRISKLMIKRGNEIVANYDRDWDVRPSDSDTEKAVEIILSAES